MMLAARTAAQSARATTPAPGPRPPGALPLGDAAAGSGAGPATSPAGAVVRAGDAGALAASATAAPTGWAPDSGCAAEAPDPLAQRSIRTAVSTAAQTRITMINELYWNLSSHQLGNLSFSIRSRSSGIAASVIGESSGRKAKTASNHS